MLWILRTLEFPSQTASFQSANLCESSFLGLSTWVHTGHTSKSRKGAVVGGAVGGSVNWWKCQLVEMSKWYWDRWGRVSCMSLRGHSQCRLNQDVKRRRQTSVKGQWTWEWEASSPWPSSSRCNTKESENSKFEPSLYIIHKIMFVMEDRRYLCLFKKVQVWIITFKYLSTWHVGLHLHNDPGPPSVGSGYISALGCFLIWHQKPWKLSKAV